MQGIPGHGTRRHRLGKAFIQNHSSHLTALRLRPRLVGGLWSDREGLFIPESGFVSMGREPVTYLNQFSLLSVFTLAIVWFVGTCWVDLVWSLF